MTQKAALVHTHDDRYYTESEVNTLLKNHLKTVYPVGSVYITLYDTSPATMFGGTWKRILDRFLIGTGKLSSGDIGGNSTHTLTIDEMPSHNHNLDIWQTGGGSTDRFSGIWGKMIHQRFSASTGGSKPHNNMPPYMAVYMWHRTA